MFGNLPPRERQIMEALHMRGEATVAEVREALGDAVSAAALRVMMGRLEAKGVVKRRAVDRTYVYAPTEQTQEAANTALLNVVKTLFGGSAVSAANALLGMGAPMAPEELDALEQRLVEARKAQKG